MRENWYKRTFFFVSKKFNTHKNLYHQVTSSSMVSSWIYYKTMGRFTVICDSNILCSFTCHLNPFYNPIRSYTQACTICVIRVNKVRTGPPNLWGVSNLLVAQNSVFYKRKNHSLDLQILVIYSKFQIPSWTPAYLEYFGPLVLLSIFFWWKSYFHRILLTVYFYCRH